MSVAARPSLPVPQPAAPATDLAEDVVLTPLGARGAGSRMSRAERSARTHHLLGLAAASEDPAERESLLGEVVLLNCRVADAVAARHRDRGVPLEDLRQAAYEGLVKAVRRFDHGQAEDLLTFAVPTIRGEVLRHFRDRSWMVRPPRRVQELQGRISAAVANLAHELGREPSDEEIRSRLDITSDEYAEVVTAFGCFHPPSLDRPVGDGSDGVTLGDLLADEHHDHDAVEARCLLGPAVRALDEQARLLLYLRFYEERSQREIGEDLGLTQTQVSRMLERVLRRIRHAVEQGPTHDDGHRDRRA